MRDDVPRKFEYEAALKEGYSPTEILDYFVKINSSKFSRLPEGRSAVVLYLFLGAGALVWLLGLALRYVFAGPSV